MNRTISSWFRDIEHNEILYPIFLDWLLENRKDQEYKALKWIRYNNMCPSINISGYYVWYNTSNPCGIKDELPKYLFDKLKDNISWSTFQFERRYNTFEDSMVALVKTIIDYEQNN